MKVSQAKENILKRIRQALGHSTPLPFPQSEGNNSVFKPLAQDLEIEFAERFTQLQGKFIFCADHLELEQQLQNLATSRGWKKIFCSEPQIRSRMHSFFESVGTSELAPCDASVTLCELLIARTGSIVLSSAQPYGRTASVYAPIHICIAYSSQLVYDIKEGLQKVKDKYSGQLPSLISFATGPSRTADIEKTLVVGVHGPKEVYLFLVDEHS